MSREELPDKRGPTGLVVAAGQQTSHGSASRLVFGLSSRTNRLRHDEYAERRMRQPASHLGPREDSNKSASGKQQPKNSSSDNYAPQAGAEAPGGDPMRVAHCLLSTGATQPAANKQPTTTTDKTPPTPATNNQTMKEPEQQVSNRKRFNIPPPPIKSLKSPGKSSVVSYAKSKIYAEQQAEPRTNSILDTCVVPHSILSGFKPPKQVDVSKACERWEGGEPFAKCKSRQRLQAAKDSKWIQLRDASANFSSSIAATSSLVAMQRHQIQQQAANSASSPQNGPLKVLSRGSVLERAQKFEKTPPAADGCQVVASQPPPCDLATSEQTTSSTREATKTNKSQQPAQALISRHTATGLAQLTPIRRHSTGAGSNSSSSIPRFYHPNGKPNTYELELQKRNIVACFNKLPERSAQLQSPVSRRHFQSIAVACGFSDYWKEPLLLYVKHQLTSSNLLHSGTVNKRQQAGALIRAASIENSTLERTNRQTQISCEQFLICWREMVSSAIDEAARFVHLLTLGQRNYLVPDDFVPLLQSIIDHHPGLVFLKGAPDFHMRYTQTVIARIYFCVNRSWTGKISLPELRASNLLQVIRRLSVEEDINKMTDYFSYEHFYVIYCKFWCLDQDHDLLISKDDLARHNDSAISVRIIERIFLGIVSKQIQKTGKMSYSDFVWFLIAEEDKKQTRSIEYWFRLMDIDGDGYISMYEMEYFYEEQVKRLEAMNIEALPYIDSVCQILDLVNPKHKNKISLSDLKQTQMAPIFFDTFINIEKYLEHESREFVSSRDVLVGGRVVSEWERYASEEYESLVSEESSV